jgi:hypothetical protein
MNKDGTNGKANDDQRRRDSTGEGRRKRGRPRRTEPQPQQLAALERRMAGKTQKEIAEQVGVSEKTIGRWLNAPYIRREVAKRLRDASARLWSNIASESGPAWDDFVEDMRNGDPRLRARDRKWLFERLLEIEPMPRLIKEGLLAEDAVPRSLDEPSDAPNDEEEAG